MNMEAVKDNTESDKELGTLHEDRNFQAIGWYAAA